MKKLLTIILSVIMLFVFCSCYSFYETPKEAVQSSFDELIDNSKYNLVDEEIDTITVDDCTIYIYTSQDTIQIGFLKKDNNQYYLKSLKSYYSANDLNDKIEGPVLIDDKSIYFNLRAKKGLKDKEFLKENYKISAFDEVKEYYFSYKVVWIL